jgi:hypothetical protein
LFSAGEELSEPALALAKLAPGWARTAKKQRKIMKTGGMPGDDSFPFPVERVLGIPFL